MTSVHITHVPVAGSAALQHEGVLATLGLGSCVAVMLYCPDTRTGSLAHVLLPSELVSRDRSRPAKFGTTAVAHLLNEMRLLGASADLRAFLVGGASMFGRLLDTGGINMGERNVTSLRVALARAAIPVAAEDVGGEFGRSVYFDVATGDVRVTSVRHGERTL